MQIMSTLTRGLDTESAALKRDDEKNAMNDL